MSVCLLAALAVWRELTWVFQELYLTAGCTAASCPVCNSQPPGTLLRSFLVASICTQEAVGLLISCEAAMLHLGYREMNRPTLAIGGAEQVLGLYDPLSPLGTKHFPRPSSLLGLFLTFFCPDFPDPCFMPNPAQTQQLLLP